MGDSVGFAIPIDRAAALVAQINAGQASATVLLGYPGQLGVVMSEPAPATVPGGAVEGVTVAEVMPGSPAASAGVVAGDTLTEVDGQPATSPEQVVGPDQEAPGRGEDQFQLDRRVGPPPQRHRHPRRRAGRLTELMADQQPWRRVLRIAGALAVAGVMAATAVDLSRDSEPSFGGSDGREAGPSPTAPSQSRDPSAGLLTNLIVSDADVGPSQSVVGLPGGNGLSQPTLDLCNGTYASESSRTARLQVVAIDDQRQTTLSTEAVLYSSGAGTAAAFSELKQTAAACPDRPVEKPGRRVSR